MVRNISSSGARLDIATPVGLPPTFTLVIQTDQFMRRCRPIWGNDNRIGVANSPGHSSFPVSILTSPPVPPRAA